MRIECDDGTLLLHDAPDDVPHAEWDDRVDEYPEGQARFYLDVQRCEAASNGYAHSGNGAVTGDSCSSS